MKGHISNFFKQALERYGLYKESYAAYVCGVGNMVIARDLGEKFASRAHAIRFIRGELVIEVESPVWAAELQARGEQLKSAVNEKISGVDVRESEVSIGSSPEERLVRRIRFVVRAE